MDAISLLEDDHKKVIAYDDEMFKQARQVFSREELTDLGERMAARKDELQGALR